MLCNSLKLRGFSGGPGRQLISTSVRTHAQISKNTNWEKRGRGGIRPCLSGGRSDIRKRTRERSRPGSGARKRERTWKKCKGKGGHLIWTKINKNQEISGEEEEEKGKYKELESRPSVSVLMNLSGGEDEKKNRRDGRLILNY